MDMMARNEFDDLMGAFALDACEADEVAAMEEYLAAHPEAIGDVERLREAAVWLGASEASTPPAAMRAGLLARARLARPNDAAASLDAYRLEVERLSHTLRDLDADTGRLLTHNGLTIRELILHLGVAERTLASELVHPRLERWDDALMRHITATELDDTANLSLADAIERWEVAAARVLELAAHADHMIAGRRVGDMLVIRAFETWTHHDDIRLALDQSESVPAPPVLRSMVEFSVRNTPWALAMSGTIRPGATADLHLTGAVDGIWNVALNPDEAISDNLVAVMTIDVVDWCKRFADRRPIDLAYTVVGDADVARDLIVAAPAFAGL
jgi:uncharacterized protein (TIGR03083 family)